MSITEIFSRTKCLTRDFHPPLPPPPLKKDSAKLYNTLDNQTAAPDKPVFFCGPPQSSLRVSLRELLPQWETGAVFAVYLRSDVLAATARAPRAARGVPPLVLAFVDIFTTPALLPTVQAVALRRNEEPSRKLYLTTGSASLRPFLINTHQASISDNVI